MSIALRPTISSVSMYPDAIQLTPGVTQRVDAALTSSEKVL